MHEIWFTYFHFGRINIYDSALKTAIMKANRNYQATPIKTAISDI